jgi:hypothetical protein
LGLARSLLRLHRDSEQSLTTSFMAADEAMIRPRAHGRQDDMSEDSHGHYLLEGFVPDAASPEMAAFC